MADARLLEQPLEQCTLVFFDIETTGLDPVHDHVIEVATVTVRAGQEIGAFSTLVRPVVPGSLFSMVEIPEEIVRITGITASDLDGKPAFDEVYSELLKSLGDAVLVAHNAEFDMSFLAPRMKELGPLPANSVIDTLRLSRAVAPELPSHSMDNLKRIYKIAAEKAHRALDDTRSLAQLFPKLLARGFPRGVAKLGDLIRYHGPLLPFAPPPPEKARGSSGRGSGRYRG